MGAKEPKYQPRLAQLRENSGLTQLELSQRVGVTETTIANWERGRSGMDWFVRIMKLCSALNCQPQDLIEEQMRLSDIAALAGESERSQPAESDEAMRLSQLAELTGEVEQSEPSALEESKEHTRT